MNEYNLKLSEEAVVALTSLINGQLEQPGVTSMWRERRALMEIRDKVMVVKKEVAA